jgi:cell division protein FtsQ
MQIVAQGVTSASARQLGSLGLRLKTVRLEGLSPSAAPDVIAAAGLHAGTPILGLDLEAVRQKVEAVGWVKSARVMRLLPDTLVIAAQEKPRLAVWQLHGATAVIDADGKPIPEADPGRFPELPLVVGEGAGPAAPAVLSQIATRPRLAQRVEALVRVDGRRWDLRLKDGGLIQLPAGGEDSALIQLDQLDQKARLLELGFARVDLRDPELVTVRPRAAGDEAMLSGMATAPPAPATSAPAPAGVKG